MSDATVSKIHPKDKNVKIKQSVTSDKISNSDSKPNQKYLKKSKINIAQNERARLRAAISKDQANKKRKAESIKKLEARTSELLKKELERFQTSNHSTIHDLKHLGDVGKSTKFALKISEIPTSLDWRSLKETCLQYGAVTFVIKTSSTEGIVTFATRKDLKNAKEGLEGRSIFGNQLVVEYLDKSLAIIPENPKKTETVKRVHDSNGKYCRDEKIARPLSPVWSNFQYSKYDDLVDQCKNLSNPKSVEQCSETA